MLRRHGTRLDIGTAEDVAELNAAEAVLRAAFKQSAMDGSTASGSGGGGHSHIHPSSGDASRFHPRSTGSYGTVDQPTAFTASAAAAMSGGGVAQTPISAYSTGASGAPPHVHLGHSTGGSRAGPSTMTAAAAAGGAAPPTPPSASSTATVQAQRALYRSDVMSPGGRTTTASTGTTATTGYAPSSTSAVGRTPGGAEAGVRRGTAQPLFHSPRSSDNDDVVEHEEEGGGGHYPGEVLGRGEGVGEVDRGRPSMRRAPFAVPVPAAAGGGVVSRGTGTYGRHGAPPPPRYVSAAAARGMAERGDSDVVEVNDDEEEEEEVTSRPSRVSGRYQLPPSPG